MTDKIIVYCNITKCLILRMSGKTKQDKRDFLRFLKYLPGGGHLGSETKDRKLLVAARKDRNNEATCKHIKTLSYTHFDTTY